MAEVNELINVKYDGAKASHDVFLKSIFSENLIGYLRNEQLSSYEEMLTLEILNLSGKRFADKIRGIKYLKNLREIDLLATSATDIGELGGLTKLEKLNLYLTNITTIDSLHECKSLRYLYLPSTIQPSVNLDWIRNLSELEYLNISDIKMVSITSLGGLNKLKTIIASNMGMTSMDSSKLNFTKLEEIDLSNNNLDTNRVNGLLQGANTAKASGKPLRVLNLGGPNMGIPTGGDANADVVALRAAGVTVTIRTE